MTSKIFIAGDIVILSEKQNIVDEELKKIITHSDMAICNFEAPIKSEGNPIPKAGPHLSQHPKAIDYVKDAGFNICSLANNHFFDYGIKGVETTLNKFKSLNIDTCGAGLNFNEANQLLIKQVNGIKFGFLAFCEGEFGVFTNYSDYGAVAYVNHYSTNSLIRNSKNEVDFLIVIVHAGVENVDLPLPEWRHRYKEICDLGADTVIGHHPHVPQGWETHDGKPIFYSLGNFYFDRESKSENFSYSVILEFNDKHLSEFKIITHLKSKGITSLVSANEFNEKLKILCEKLGNSYYFEIDKLIIELYNKRYKLHYQNASLGHHAGMTLFKRLKRFIYNLIFRNISNIKNNLLLLHNIRIESHRFVMERALHLLYEAENQK